jgi:hypothetical protein
MSYSVGQNASTASLTRPSIALFSIKVLRTRAAARLKVQNVVVSVTGGGWITDYA